MDISVVYQPSTVLSSIWCTIRHVYRECANQLGTSCMKCEARWQESVWIRRIDVVWTKKCALIPTHFMNDKYSPVLLNDVAMMINASVLRKNGLGTILYLFSKRLVCENKPDNRRKVMMDEGNKRQLLTRYSSSECSVTLSWFHTFLLPPRKFLVHSSSSDVSLTQIPLTVKRSTSENKLVPYPVNFSVLWNYLDTQTVVTWISKTQRGDIAGQH